MHQTSLNLMKRFVEKYLPEESVVLDFGGTQTYGSYKDIILENNSIYKTLDWEDSDYIVNGYDWSNVPKKNFDALISGQAFEHDSYFWKTLSNIKDVVKEDGLIILIMPSKGGYHKYPIDCYRFYPDSALVFAELMNADIIEVTWNNNLATGWVGSVDNKLYISNYEFDTEWVI